MGQCCSIPPLSERSPQSGANPGVQLPAVGRHVKDWGKPRPWKFDDNIPRAQLMVHNIVGT